MRGSCKVQPLLIHLHSVKIPVDPSLVDMSWSAENKWKMRCKSIRYLERAAGTTHTAMVMLINLVRRNTVLPSPQNPPEMGNCRHQGEEQQSPPTKQYIGNTILIKQPFTDTKALYERMNQRNLDDAHAITQHCVMTQFLLLGTLKPTQFSTLKKASYRVEKHDSGRRFRFRWTTFKAPDDFDIELLDPRRV